MRSKERLRRRCSVGEQKTQARVRAFKSHGLELNTHCVRNLERETESVPERERGVGGVDDGAGGF